jgi:hypothetical protein
MSNPSASFTPNAFPNGMDQTLGHVRLEGYLTVAPGTSGVYQANGVPISFNSNMAGYNPTPFMCWLESQNYGYEYKFDPTNQTMHIFQDSQFPGGFPPAVVAGSFAASANWGSSPTLAPSATSNQQAFALTITAQASTGANPTITVTFSQPFEQAPTFVCSRGDSLADAGYFVFTSSTPTTAVFTFVGTPTATHVYVLDAFGVSSINAQPALATTAFTMGSGWGTTPTLAMVGTPVQNAFEMSITAQTTTSANPTVLLTFPTPYASAPQFVVARADILADAGYFVVTGSTPTTVTFTFIGTPTATHVYKFAALMAGPKTSAVTPAAFAASANFGATPTIVVAGNQGAFTASVTTPSSGTGANPTLTLTFPTPLSAAPNFVCARGDALATAGYWVVTSTSTTTAVFTFIGTPAASSTYTLDAVGQFYGAGIDEFPVGGIVPSGVLVDTILCEAITTRT